MGDISEMRGIVTTVSFLGMLVFLIALFPSQFYAVDYEGKEVNVPEYFEGIDIQNYKETWTYCLNESGGIYDPIGKFYQIEIDIGQHDWSLHYKCANTTDKDLTFYHKWFEWVFFLYYHNMELINSKGVSRGDYLEETELNTDYSNNEGRYKIECIHFFGRGIFGYNTTIYSSPSEAWDYHALWIFIGINFDQTATGYNAWDLIGMILFWQLPDMHWVVNAIISFPFWGCIAYLAYILILRTIGAIFGGGA